MSILTGMITDRTQADVDRVIELKNKILDGGYSSLTNAERKEYEAGMRGAYNYSDLNRVGQACQTLYYLFTEAGYAMSGFTTPKTDWTVSDVPTASQLASYLANMEIIKRAAHRSQIIPATMDRLGYEDANNIEKLLVQADEYISIIMSNWAYSGEFETGEY